MKHMETVLQWTEHKAPPIPILLDSELLLDSLFLYGVDYMSNDDVKRYFKNYSEGQTEEGTDDGAKDLAIKWINDSSCVVQLPSEALARKAYDALKLSEKRMDDRLPPLTLYLEDLNEMKRQEFEKKQKNPDYDVLFGQQEEPQPEQS